MNEAQKQALVWGGIIFLVVLLFPPHEAIYMDGTSYRFLFSEPNSAYEMAAGKWIMYLVIVAGVTFGIVSKAGSQDSD
ncbi:hypothetical protein DYI22_08520 [Marinobacter lipolyticus]|jgi:hypothetical protein|uniref:hypothetical protein n=1 Tax=Marinobacter TaxID=2742 RepID=UPI000C90DA74|nr:MULTISPECIES: hypothetical protein [Marinobacter]MAK49170.1 hypothetical protein [Marinobacter sp.]MBS8240549.1 hypothetical protein [Marinobacter lipolyticus]|tara:strand:- start:655 stop:888 length:234 start_codon:yes stop_codon:yes gene_type:complete